MLPAPASFHRARPLLRPRHPLESIVPTLLQRSRVTNLAVLLLIVLLAVSLLFNGHTWFTTAGSLEPSVVAIRDIQTPKLNTTRLVVVAGHAIWKGCAKDATNPDAEAHWVLEEYQKGQQGLFVEHMKRGVQIATEDDQSLLVFSGGYTRPHSATSEAESYLRLAQSALLPPNFPRVTSENYALDSYQNLLFSIARFHELTGTYPTSITVVGFEMKRRRFEELHTMALSWPKHRFKYVGVEAEGDTKHLYEGEKQNGYLPFSKDLYGCHGFLLSKRQKRNPSRRFHPYFSSSPPLRGLLEWCPTERQGWNKVFPGWLPWL